VIIKTQKVDPRAERGVRIIIKESDRDESSLEKSPTDKLISPYLYFRFKLRRRKLADNLLYKSAGEIDSRSKL
jgi:hypothetical protein